MRMTDLQPGWDIVSNDGRRLGTVKDVGQNYVQTSAAAGSARLYVPASAIGNVADGVVHLNVAYNDVRGMGWEQPPRDDDTPETSGEADLHRHV
jgi:hypothetical protein